MPFGLSARERVLPIWDVLYSSKVESWVGMLLERVIRGVVVAVGLTARRRRGRGRVRVTPGTWDRDGEAGLGAIHQELGGREEAGLVVPKQGGAGGKLKRRFMLGRPGHQHQGNHRAEKTNSSPWGKVGTTMPEPITCGCRRGPPHHPLPPTGSPNPSAWTPQTLQEHGGPARAGQGSPLALPGTPRVAGSCGESPEGG